MQLTEEIFGTRNDDDLFAFVVFMCFVSQGTTILQHKGFMRLIPHLGVLCSARFASSATIPPLQLTSPSSDDVMPGGNITNNITAVGDIDPGFRIKATYSDVDIPQNDCLMNVIIAMGIVSAGEPFGHIKPTTYFDLRYVGARVLTSSTSPSGMILSCYVLWGLYQAIRPMIQWNSWKEAEFTLLLDGETVGFILFKKTGFLPPSLQGSTNTIAQSRRSTPPSAALGIYSPAIPSQRNSSQPNPIDTIDVRPTGFRSPMPKIHFFMAIVECFLYLGPKVPRESLSAFSVAPSPYDATMRLAPVRRTEPPFFDYGDAALGLANLPSKLISDYQQKWSEVIFIYCVGGVMVGQGSITRSKSD